MTALQRIAQIAAGLLKYGALAAAAVATVQAEIGPSGGDAGVQASKKALAVAYILAVAHAGESVPIPQVQLIASVVELAAGTAKALGLGGKTPAASGVVVVPAMLAT